MSVEEVRRPVSTAGETEALPVDHLGTHPAERPHRQGMSVGEAVRVALQGLASNKLRSLLTMLGVIIGVGSVITTMAIGQGANEAARATLRAMGTNTLTLFTGQQRRGGINFGAGTITTLKPEDAEAILKECPAVKAIAQESSSNVRVKFQNQNTGTNILGTTPDYPSIRNFTLAQGRFITDSEVRRRAKVVVLGASIQETLFGNLSPLNKTIKVNGQSFKVIGSFKAKGGTGWRNPDDQIWAPVTTVMRRVLGRDYLSGMTIQAVSEERMVEAQDQIEALIRKRHKILEGEPTDVVIRNQADLVETAQQQSNILTRLLTGIAVVSLVVGGIGIMNIMLVTVTERTREIGIRKAIGAKSRDIRNQFLIEAITMSITGGLLGIGAGLLASYLMSTQAGWTTLVTPMSLILSFGFSAIVGVVFGVYPASKASRLNPIEALRYE
jgi:putative ABC transport system permease protein